MLSCGNRAEILFAEGLASRGFIPTNKKVTEIIEQASGKKHDKNFTVVSNPEFLREGCSVKDFYTPPYTLIGTANNIAIDKLKKLYKK